MQGYTTNTSSTFLLFSAGRCATGVGATIVKNAAWFYPPPSKSFAAMAHYIAFYPAKMDACFVNDELAQAQEGDFYGGWITSGIVGPFEGGARTWD